MNTLYAKLNRDFKTWKQLGNNLVGLNISSGEEQTIDIYFFEITSYNKKYEPTKLKSLAKYTNRKIETWPEIEQLVFGDAKQPDFAKTLN